MRSVVNKIKNHFDDVENLRINAVGCDIDKSLCEQYGWTHIDSIASTDKEIETLQSQLLPQCKDKIREVHLEDFVDSLIKETGGEYKKVFGKFKKRYLEWK